MGDYAKVRILFAESDFDREEREFMAVLWDRFFGPKRLIDCEEPDWYQTTNALREKVHAELRLPGTADDWRFILTEEIDGRRYYHPLDSLDRAVIPPFPRRFADVPCLSKKYGIKPTWYALFSAPDHQGGGFSFVSTFGAARRQFRENFWGVWRLLFSGEDEQELEALVKAAPEASDERKCLEAVFDRFPLIHYLETLELLAGDWGRDALIKLDYGSILYNYDPDPKKAADLVQAECESAGRLFAALRRLDVSALRGEGILRSQTSYEARGAGPWIALYEHRDAVCRFQREFFTYLGEQPWS